MPLDFPVTLALYVTESIGYMPGAKHCVTIDTVLLASWLTLHAGGSATAIVLSFWLLAFAVFMFTGLGKNGLS